MLASRGKLDGPAPAFVVVGKVKVGCAGLSIGTGNLGGVCSAADEVKASVGWTEEGLMVGARGFTGGVGCLEGAVWEIPAGPGALVVESGS